MKKIFIYVSLLVMMIAVTASSFTMAYADANEDESDRVFFETLNEIIEDEGVVTTENTFTKEMIYDLRLKPLGYIYYIGLEEKSGFAVSVNTDGIFTITELYLDAKDPYEGYDGQKIYVNLMFYVVWDGENFVETTHGLVIDPDDEVFAENVLYGSDYLLTPGSERVYYTNRVRNDHELAKSYPAYLPVGLTNGCVPTAGANIIGYYTRFYPELVPGFTPGRTFGEFYLYYEFPSGIDPVLLTLSEYMETNVGQPGTSVSGFKKGMTRYCNEKGRSISYDSCMTKGKFDYDLAKQKFESGQPSVMFVNTFTVAKSLLNYDGYEVISYVTANADHAMAGFGYTEITYTLSDGTTRNDNYIMVATGLVQYESGYFNVNNISNIDDYYSINIY